MSKSMLFSVRKIIVTFFSENEYIFQFTPVNIFTGELSHYFCKVNKKWD